MGNLSTKSIGLHFCLHVGDCLYGIFYRKNGIYSLHNSFHIFTNCLFWLKQIVFFSLTWATLKIKNGSSRKRTFMKNDKINKKAKKWKNGKTEKAVIIFFRNRFPAVVCTLCIKSLQSKTKLSYRSFCMNDKCNYYWNFLMFQFFDNVTLLGVTALTRLKTYFLFLFTKL